MDNALREVLRRAKASPFYRGRALSGPWKNLPLTRKADLRSAHPFGFLAVPRTRLASYHESSGSEGEPIASYFTENDWSDIAERFTRNAVGISPQDTILIKTPYSMVTTAHQVDRAARLKGALIVPADNRSANMPYSRVVSILQTVGISLTWSLPTECFLWNLAARQNGLDPKSDFPSLRGFIVAGESLSPAKKAQLTRLWGGVPVYEDYGSTETGSLAGQCPWGSLHLWSDRIHFEVFDEKENRFLPEGRGKLVVTPLFREAMPLVRYLMDDEVEVSLGPCGCGQLYPTVKILGRASSLRTVQGKCFFPGELEDLVYTAGAPHGLTLWRAIIADRTLEIEILADRGAESPIRSLVRERLGIDATVHSRPVGSFIGVDSLTRKHIFSKPRFIVEQSEDPAKALSYF